MSKETVLITGASSGIGWELAKLFAQDGSHLILVARREEKLQELANELKSAYQAESTIIPMDLGQPGAASQLIEQIDAQGTQIDVLVNNAGFGQFGQFSDIDRQRHLDMIDVNISSLVDLTYLVLPQMLKRSAGSILNLGSTASFQPGPNAAVYYATKAFVLSFSEAIWQELLGTGVNVCVLCPGPTRTGFGEDSKMDQTAVFKMNSMDVVDVAKVGHRGVRRRKRLVIPGIMNNIMAWGVRLAPRRFILRIMERLQSSD